MRRREMNKIKNSQRGMTLIELMLALTILAVGVVAVSGLVITGVASNTRNRLDTGGTFAAQGVLETIAGQPAGTDVSMKDCAGNLFTVKTAGGATGVATGATLMTDGTGRIDFTAQTNAAVTAGYAVMYAACGPNNSTVTYDVRWNIQTISQFSKLVTVAALQKNGVSSIGTKLQVRFFNPPVNLRTIVATGN